jgi:hypothetical protein
MTEENNCYYLSSEGFRKSCDKMTDIHYINEDFISSIKQNEILYIKTDFLYHFSKIIDKINCSFILVSGHSDYTIPYDIFTDIDEFMKFISNNKIIHLFAQNCIYQHEKITNLPIGMDYHTLNWKDTCKPSVQENELIDIIKTTKPFYLRENKCYSTFHFSYAGYKFESDRIDALQSIPPSVVFFEEKRIRRTDTWINQTNYAFVISPHGNGLDCHRTWEALVLGCIPIVKKSDIDALYDDLPVLILNNWSDLNQDLLDNTIECFKIKTFNYEKLTLKFWIDKMRKITKK